ncbi:MAG: HAD-IA family hydrolase [Syntrophaceae bacterium]
MAPTVSFDLDGTLSTQAFAEAVWDGALPGALARRRGIPLEESRRFCQAAYAAEGDGSIRWYQLPYWLETLGLSDLDPKDLIRAGSAHMRLFEDAIPTLERLKDAGVNLVIFSNAARIFLDAEVDLAGLDRFVSESISVTDDWGMVKADPRAFEKLLEHSGPCVHVGDHVHYDYHVPRTVGIEAYHIWRGSGERTTGSITNLMDIMKIVAQH